MMDNIQNIIADRQYQGALDNQNATIRPFEPFPKPSKEEFQLYEQSNPISLGSVLDSPIGVFEFKTYCSKFHNYNYLIDFLIQFERLKRIDAPGIHAARDLLDLALRLPSIYQTLVNTLRKKINETKPEDFPVNPDIFPDENHTPEESSNGPKKNSFFSKDLHIVSFGGYNVRDKVKDDLIISSVDVEVLNNNNNNNIVDGEDFIDRQQVMREQDLTRRSALRKNALVVFSELANVLFSKAEEVFKDFITSEQYKEMVDCLWYSDRKLSVKDFVLFRDLGRGAFGVVSSAKTKTTGTLTAIKCLNKRLIKGKKAKRLVSVEKQILETLGDNPSSFTVWLKYAFQDKDYFYMALPLCTGGDLGFHLRRKGCFDVDRARFHAAEILQGLSHLHSLLIIYRDLKPENVILDVEGHCRISDMGLATKTGGKKIRGRAGTPGYWAPEVISKQHYSFSADYWSLGCVLFEMIVGICPFSSTNSGMERDEATLYWDVQFPRVVGREDKPKLPFPSAAKKLLLGLLERDRGRRWDEAEVRQSEFFEGIDWYKLEKGELLSPWKPKPGRIHAADQLDLDVQSNDSQYRKIKLTPEDEIENFDYISKYAHQVDIVNVLKVQLTGRLEYDNNFEANCCCPM